MTQFAHIRPAIVLVIAITFGCAQAQEKDANRLTLQAGVTESDDSNYQRLPEGKGQADRIDTKNLDVNIVLPYGQQRVELMVNLNDSRHQNFTQFDFAGENHNAVWRWSLTPAFLGTLGTKHTESLVSSADSIDPTLRNKNTTDVDDISAAYLLGGPWQLFADISNTNSVNERDVVGINNIHYLSYTAGVGYAPTKGGSLRYARRLDVGTSISDFRIDSQTLLVDYAITPSTSFKGRIGYLDQRFTLDPKLDFSGLNASFEMAWQATGKTSIVGGWQREFVSFQTLDFTHAQIDSLSIAPNWQISPHLSLGMQYRRAVRLALGSLDGIGNGRQDTTNDATVTVKWQPRNYVSLTGSVTQSNRSSTVADQDFSARIATITAQFTY